MQREIAAELLARLNWRAAHDSALLALLQDLGWVSEVKNRPSKPPLQSGYPEHGKTEFFLWPHWRAHFRKAEKTNLVILCLEEKKGQTPLSSEQLYHLNIYGKHKSIEIISAVTLYIVDVLCQSEIVYDTRMLKYWSLCYREYFKYIGILVTYPEKIWVCIAQMRNFPQWLHAWYTQECLFDIFIYTE